MRTGFKNAFRCALTLLSGFFLASITATPSWSQETHANMPIADLHFHPEHDRKPETFAPVFERTGVRWFGLGERVGGRRVMLEYKEFFPDRYIAFGGQSIFSTFFDKLGADRVNNPEILDNPDFKDYSQRFRRSLAAKEIVGLGELFVNNRKTHPDSKRGIKIKIDGPAIRSLFELAATYGAFLAFHMEGDSDSVEQLEALASSNRKGRIILNHCGVNASSQTVERLFSAHPNLFCEFSSRYDPTIPGVLGTSVAIFDRLTIRGGWKDVIIKHADRFMVGTDVNGQDRAYEQAINNVRLSLLSNLPPEVARAVAYGNAKRLFNLK
jgi:hypothetical protein